MSNVEIPNKPRAYQASVITVSDTSSAGMRPDLCGPAVAVALETAGFQITGVRVVRDDSSEIQEAIIEACAEARLIITTGGTGITERDVTPEATRAVCDQLIEGITEHIRRECVKNTPWSILSRAVCGSRGHCMVLNLPGTPSAAVDALRTVLPVLRHALDLLAGRTAHLASGASE